MGEEISFITSHDFFDILSFNNVHKSWGKVEKNCSYCLVTINKNLHYIDKGLKT